MIGDTEASGPPDFICCICKVPVLPDLGALVDFPDLDLGVIIIMGSAKVAEAEVRVP